MKTIETTWVVRAATVTARWPWALPIEATAKSQQARAGARCVTRMCISRAASGIVLLLTLGVCAPADLSAEPASRAEPKVESPDLVEAALLAEATGNRELHRKLVREAIEKHPDSSLAHWCAGEVRRDGRWLSLEEAHAQAASDERLAEYRRLRDQQAGTPAGRLALAGWCRDHGLTAESRVHWMQVLMDQPENEEALKALGARWHHGQLLTHAQIKEANRRQKPTAKFSPRSMDRWVSPVAKWRIAFKQGNASSRERVRTEIAAVKDPREMYALGALLIKHSRRKSDPKGYLLVSLELIDALDYRGEPWAVKQLAWHALEHPKAEVRNAAADALQAHPRVSYIPWLLSHMQTPVEARFVVTPALVGIGVEIRQTLEREGPDAIYRDVRKRHYSAVTPKITISRRWGTRRTNIAKIARNPQIAQKSWRDAENYTAAMKDRIERTNLTIEDLNQRIQDVINRATGETMDANPSSWQRWWMKYCCSYYELEPAVTDQSGAGPYSSSYPYDYDRLQPESKPVIERHLTIGMPVRISLVSCFPSNTKVWISTGAEEIGQIKPGDLVLSQEPFTGELLYQPVLQVTRRKPSPMIEIGLGSETIRTTRGHPFWVCGEGWAMAKHLTADMWLHSTDGPVLIDRVDQIPAASPWYEQPDAKPGEELSYNLILEGCHNYFVGQQKIMAHDNTFFPLDGPVPAVPGLASSKPATRPSPSGNGKSVSLQ